MSMQTIDSAVSPRSAQDFLAFLHPQQLDGGADVQSKRTENMSGQYRGWLSDARVSGPYTRHIMPKLHEHSISQQLYDSQQCYEVAVALYTGIAEAWELDTSDTARLLGVSQRDWEKICAKEKLGSEFLNDSLVLRINHILGIYLALHVIFDAKLANAWVKLHNEAPLFKEASPLAVMSKGGDETIKKVRHYLDAASSR